jgi:membrane protein DedA with SNARE-associated domain
VIGQVVIEILSNLGADCMTGTLPELGYWSYLVLAFLVAIEGPSVTILGALLASTGALRPGWVFLAASMGNLSADIGWYMLGYLGRFEVLLRHIGWLQPYQGRINRLEHEMTRHAAKILLVAKLTLSMSIPALIAAGMARVPWRRWLPVLLLGECLWTGGLVLIGFYLGQYIKQLEQGMQIIAVIGTLIFVVIGIWLIKRVSSSSQLDIT